MTKTIKEWFDLLIEPVRSEAIKNVSKHKKDYHGGAENYLNTETADSVYDAIDKAITWTADGNTMIYWGNICRHLDKYLK